MYEKIIKITIIYYAQLRQEVQRAVISTKSLSLKFFPCG
jgi:hypothetical protein